MVVDADGLNCLAGNLAVLKKRKSETILTPHPGEMARLLGSDAAAVNADRVGVALDFAKKHGVVLVLKGAGTVVACPDGEAFVNPTGNPGMASGGMGDVLTGMIGAFLAQGLTARDAAVCGVYLHGLAGDIAAEAVGERALLARDVINSIGRAFDQVESDDEEEETCE